MYSEKPLAVSLEDGKRVLDLAKAKNLRVGCAPDTFLGAGIQTARYAIQNGMIGQPVATTASLWAEVPNGGILIRNFSMPPEAVRCGFP